MEGAKLQNRTSFSARLANNDDRDKMEATRAMEKDKRDRPQARTSQEAGALVNMGENKIKVFTKEYPDERTIERYAFQWAGVLILITLQFLMPFANPKFDAFTSYLLALFILSFTGLIFMLDYKVLRFKVDPNNLKRMNRKSASD